MVSRARLLDDLLQRRNLLPNLKYLVDHIDTLPVILVVLIVGANRVGDICGHVRRTVQLVPIVISWLLLDSEKWALLTPQHIIIRLVHRAVESLPVDELVWGLILLLRIEIR